MKNNLSQLAESLMLQEQELAELGISTLDILKALRLQPYKDREGDAISFLISELKLVDDEKSRRVLNTKLECLYTSNFLFRGFCYAIVTNTGHDLIHKLEQQTRGTAHR